MPTPPGSTVHHLAQPPVVNVVLPKAFGADPDRPPARAHRQRPSSCARCHKLLAQLRRSLFWRFTVAPLVAFLVPGLGLGFVATLSGIGELSHAAGSVAHATANVSTAVTNIAVASSSGTLHASREACSGVDLLDVQVTMESGSLLVDWLGDFRGFVEATSNFTLQTSASLREKLFAVVDKSALHKPRDLSD